MEPGKVSVVRYAINPKISRFTVHAFASGVLSAFGHNPKIAIRDFAGEAQVDFENFEDTSLRITVKAASLEVADDVSDKDRREMERQMQQDVLESSNYPEILYECSRVSASKTGEGQYGITLNGDLTLHGVTRSEPISAKAVLNGDTLRAFGEFSVRQTDYDIKLVSALGGALKVKDELKFAFDFVARKLG
jgi:polyisoprenoid-binding protein YceI